MSETPLFDTISWRDPLSGAPLEPIIAARTPNGLPVCGAMRVAGTNVGYPIVDCVVRLTADAANRHRQWLEPYGLVPPPPADGAFQPQETVDSFGFQWAWVGDMRTEADLQMRVADRFGVDKRFFSGKLVLDSGAGAGDQSRFLVEQGAKVVSIDLSNAIDVVASKLRMSSSWVGVQGDITMLPFTSGQFDVVYCEGVIQHTRDSVMTVRELVRVAKAKGQIIASHYTRNEPRSLFRRMVRRMTVGYYEFLRRRLSSMKRFPLLFTTGLFAALAYVPLIGWLVRRTGTALYYDIQSDFQTTWMNTYDFYGAHAFQRFITNETFASYFKDAGGARVLRQYSGALVAEKE
jgi:ubiquinone/menaquinone biosynthesis C-methylase UbiE